MRSALPLKKLSRVTWQERMLSQLSVIKQKTLSWTVASEFCCHQSHKREVTRQKETGWDILHQNRRYTIKCMFKNDSVNFFGSWGINDSLPDALGTIKDDRVIILADGTCLLRGYYIAHAHFTVRVFEMSLFRLWIVLFRHSVGSTSEHASVF